MKEVGPARVVDSRGTLMRRVWNDGGAWRIEKRAEEREDKEEFYVLGEERGESKHNGTSSTRFWI